MSTRAIFTFKGFGETHHVYKHHDGYMTGAAAALGAALKMAWTPPRYEPEEFGAAFVAANKPEGGGIRLARKRTEHVDVEYGYTVEPDRSIPSLLKLTVHDTCYWDGFKQTKIWSGPLLDFIANAEQIEEEYFELDE